MSPQQAINHKFYQILNFMGSHTHIPSLMRKTIGTWDWNSTVCSSMSNFTLICALCYPSTVRNHKVTKFWISGLPILTALHCSGGNMACDRESMVCSFLPNFSLIGVHLDPLIKQKYGITSPLHKHCILEWLATYRHAPLGNLFSEVVRWPQSLHLKNLFTALWTLTLWPSEMHRSERLSAVYLHCMHQIIINHQQS